MTSKELLKLKIAEQKAYWNKRAEARLVKSEELGNKAILQAEKIYREAAANVQSMIDSIYRNYSKNIGQVTVLDAERLKKALDPLERNQFLKDVRANAIKLGLDPDKVFDDRYLFRLSRLEALNAQLQLEVYATAPDNVTIAERSFREILVDTYKGFNADITTSGVTPSFSYLDKEITDVILRSEWAGGNYSTRIWKNTDILAKKLPGIIGAAMNSGSSLPRTSAILRQQFEVSKFAAARLIRTETAYMDGQAQAQGFIDNEVEYYTLDVTMDGHTSDICKKIEAEAKVYKVSEISVGENYNPLHPFCRTIAVAEFELEKGDTRISKAERLARYETILASNAEIQSEQIPLIANELRKKT